MPENVGTTAAKISRGVPVAGIIFGAVGMAIDAASIAYYTKDILDMKKDKQKLSLEFIKTAKMMTIANAILTKKTCYCQCHYLY